MNILSGSQIATPNKLKSHQISCLAFVFQGVMKNIIAKLLNTTQIMCAHTDTI